MRRSWWWWSFGLALGCAGAAAGPGVASRPTAPKPASSNVTVPTPAASSATPTAQRFERVADGFGLSSGSPWGAVARIGTRTLVASDSNLGGTIAVLEFQTLSPTAARQTLPSAFSSPVSVGGDWPQAWVAARFDFARQNGQSWQARKLAFPSDTDELLAARSWLGGRVLGLFVPGNRYSAANLRGGVFAVVDGRAGGEPDLHAPSCQDCRSIFALDFDALATGHAYLVGERDGQATLLEFLPTGGRGIYVPTPSFEPLSATFGPSGRVIALSPHEVYFGAGHRLPIVYRYDGTKVEALPTPPDLPATVEASAAGGNLAPVLGLAARPDGDLWAIFGTRTGFYGPGVSHSRLYRRDRAGHWQRENLPPEPDGAAADLIDVAASNDSVWVLGHVGDRGVVYRSAIAPGDPVAADTAVVAPDTAHDAPGYGAISASFDCGGVACSQRQICCNFSGFQRCVTPSQALPATVDDFASAATVLGQACRTDDFAELPWMVAVCSASSDCGAGQFCVSPDSRGMSVAHCASAVPPDGIEICREGQACAEHGSICQQGQCVHQSARVDCAGRACAAGNVCCPSAADPPLIACQKLAQCQQPTPDSYVTLPCTSRQHCASGRRCVLTPYNGSQCLDVTDASDLQGLLCASNAECDLVKCSGLGRARCTHQAETKLDVCVCPNPTSKP